MSFEKKKLSELFKDPLIWIIIICACLFWYSLSYFVPLPAHLGWPLETPLAFFIPVILYPVLEEIVFRGAVMEFLSEKIPGMAFLYLSKANILTTILFTSLHFFYHPPIWASAVIIPSLIFGLLKERYNSLIPPITMHVFFNAGYYWLFTN